MLLGLGVILAISTIRIDSATGRPPTQTRRALCSSASGVMLVISTIRMNSAKKASANVNAFIKTATLLDLGAASSYQRHVDSHPLRAKQ